MYMNSGPYFNGPDSGFGEGSSSRNNASNDLMSQMDEQQAVALLQHLDKTELELLLNSDSKLQDLVNDLNQVKNLQMRHDNLVATNKSLAEYNLSLRPKLEDLRQRVAGQYQLLNDLKTSLAEGRAQLDGHVGIRRMDTVLALLQTETATTEEASEELAEKFCEDGDMDSFLSDFLSQRALAHQRRIKTEKFAEMIQQGRLPPEANFSASTSAPLHQPPPASSLGAMSLSSPSLYQNHCTPYPSSSASFGMPLPSMFPR